MIMGIDEIKLMFQFYKSTLVLNLVFSAGLSLLFYLIAKYPIIYTLALFLMSFGFIFSILIKESSFSNKDEYYFYYNFGITKIKLIFFSSLLNIVLSSFIIAGYLYAK
jgi:hypothetical protein